MINYLKIYNLLQECERTFVGDLFVFLLILVIGILSYNKIKTFVLLFLISFFILQNVRLNKNFCFIIFNKFFKLQNVRLQLYSHFSSLLKSAKKTMQIFIITH